VPRKKFPIDVAPGGVVPTPEVAGDEAGVNRDTSIRSKHLSHFIKGKISLSPMETILMIPRELEHLESLVKVARRKRDLEVTDNQISMVSTVPTLTKICINKTHQSKPLHLLVEINNYVIEGPVDISASISVLVATIVRKLGIMHLVTGSETYKIVSGVIS
jgi:hypothetical protein